MRLRDRVAIITGAGQGIGRAYAIMMAQEGAKVVVAEINEETGAETAAQVRANGGAAIMVPTDVSDELSTRRLAEAALREYGRIDILVNNAAVYYGLTRKPFDEITLDEWDRLMGVNVRGVWLCCKAVAPTMKAQRYGKIINIASGVALYPNIGLSHYASSKGAVAAFTRALARELGDYNICVNSLAPGMVLTEATLLMTSPDAVVEGRQRRAMPRDEQPEDLLGALVFLASSESDFMTGQLLAVNGGAVMH